MERWSGRVAVVTGASSGIGEAIARDLVRKGLIVVGLARNSDKVKALAEELSESRGKLYAVKTDLRKEEDIVAAFGLIEMNKMGPVSVLVNNAGFSKKTAVLAGEVDVWRHMYEVNVFAAGVCMREAVKSMRAHGVDDGHIININSTFGHKASPTMGKEIYSSTKHALRVITDGVRRELIETNSKIKITSICPGAVETQLRTAAGDPEIGGPKLKAEEVADAVLYALSTPPSVQLVDLTVEPEGEYI